MSLKIKPIHGVEIDKIPQRGDFIPIPLSDVLNLDKPVTEFFIFKRYNREIIPHKIVSSGESLDKIHAIIKANNLTKDDLSSYHIMVKKEEMEKFSTTYIRHLLYSSSEDTKNIVKAINYLSMTLLNTPESQAIYSFSYNVAEYIKDWLESGFNNNIKLCQTVILNGQNQRDELCKHLANTTIYSTAIAAKIGCTKEWFCNLFLGSLYHDVGKIRINPSILNKKGELTLMEVSEIKSHPLLGYNIVQKVEMSGAVRRSILQHHERCDGSGYPFGLLRGEIEHVAKVISVADVLDALTTPRKYRQESATNSVEDTIKKFKIAVIKIKQEDNKYEKDIVEIAEEITKDISCYNYSQLKKNQTSHMNCIITPPSSSMWRRK